MPRQPGTAPRGALRRLTHGLVLSLLLGLVLAGLAFPVVGTAGLVAQAQSEEFLELPTGLADITPPTRTRILDKDGRLLAALFVENRVNVALANVPAHTRNAVLAIEDSRFYEHAGVDYKGTARAAIANLRDGRVSQGGSTLTQQYVKNALLTLATDDQSVRAAREDSLDRKLREARYAMALERQLTKDQILERYLNIAYFGNNVYGIGGAADYYFSLPVDKLSVAQSALLAGMVQNPSYFNPLSKQPTRRGGVLDRRNTVLGRMAQVGYLDQATASRVAATPIVLKPHPLSSGCENPAVYAPFFCDYVRRELERTDVGRALGNTLEERQRRLFSGGLVIRTSLDRKILTAAQKAVDTAVPRDDPPEDGDPAKRVAAVSNVVEPGTGLIRAMAVNRSYGGKDGTKVNLAAGGNYGFQGGSTFKPFVLAQALKDGIPLDTALYSPASYNVKAFPYEERPGVPKPVSNAEVDEAGTFDLVSGTHASVNTYYIQIEERTGFDAPAALAESLGVRRIIEQVEQPLERVPSFVFGTSGVSPLAMAGAYATFAARGTFCPPRAVLSVTGPDGAALDVPKPSCGQALDTAVADQVTSVLQGVVNGDEPLRTGRGAAIGRQVAGKTGTTNDAQAAWFVGYTPQLATAVWVGKVTPSSMTNITVNGRYYRAVYGGTIPADIFRDTMQGALDGVPEQQFELPPARSGGRSVVAASSSSTGIEGATSVPSVRGQSRESAEQTLRDAGLVPVRARRVASTIPAGLVAYTSPRSGRSVRPGGTVYLYPSAGRAPASAEPGTDTTGTDTTGTDTTGTGTTGTGATGTGATAAKPASGQPSGRRAPRRTAPAETSKPSASPPPGGNAGAPRSR